MSVSSKHEPENCPIDRCSRPVQTTAATVGCHRRAFLFAAASSLFGLGAMPLAALAAPPRRSAPAAPPVATPPAQPTPAPVVADLPAIASGGADHKVKRWDSSGGLTDTLGSLEDAVNVLLALPGGSLAAGAADGSVKIWSLASGKQAQSFAASKTAVNALACSADGKLLAVGAADGTITVWNTDTGKKLSETPAHAAGVSAMQISADGTLLVSGSGDKTIRMWKVAMTTDSGRLDYKSNIAAHDDAVTGMALATGDGLFATVSADGYLKTWRLDGGLVGRMKVCERGVASVAISPDGRLAATGDNDGRVKLWNLASNTALPTVFLHDKDNPVLAAAFASGGHLLVTASADRTIRYWNTDNGQKLKTLAAHDGAVRALALLP